MSEPTRRRRIRMRSYTRLKNALLLLGLLGLVAGVFLCMNPAWSDNTRMQLIGCAYLALFGTLLCVRTVLGGMQELVLNTELNRLKGGKDGMALLVVMIIVSILVILTFHTQSAATARFLHAERMLLQTELRAYAIDGTWQALHKLSDYKEDVMEGWNAEEPFIKATPDDNINLEVYAKRMEEEQADAAPKEPLNSETEPSAPPAGIHYDIHASAETDKGIYRLYCKVERNNSGQVKVLEWVEQVPPW